MKLSLRPAALVAILGVAFCSSPAYSQAKPDFTGTWKLNVAKSDFGGNDKPDSVVAKVEQKNNVFKYSAQGVANGQDFQEDAEVPIDGKEHPGPSGFPGTMMMKWDGTAIAFELKMDDGTIAQAGLFKLSADGKVCTRDVKGKGPDGSDTKRFEVYDKQ